VILNRKKQFMIFFYIVSDMTKKFKSLNYIKLYIDFKGNEPLIIFLNIWNI